MQSCGRTPACPLTGPSGHGPHAPNVLHVLEGWATWPRSVRWLIGGIAVVAVVALAWVLFVPAADWVATHDVGSAKVQLLQTARDAARGRLLTLGAGLFAVGALLYTARNFTLSREGQMTDRYTKAIEQLGSEKLDVRIGGIYALERIALDSAKDHPTVMEVLSTFIREHSHEQWPQAGSRITAMSTRQSRFPWRQEQGPAAISERATRPDIQAAIRVIGADTSDSTSVFLTCTASALPARSLTVRSLPPTAVRRWIVPKMELKPISTVLTLAMRLLRKQISGEQACKGQISLPGT